jgi:hypothetical protein
LTVEQRIFATLRVTFVKHRHHAIVGTALGDFDVAGAILGKIRQILGRAGVDHMPTGTIFGSGRDVASARNICNFNGIIRMDHLDLEEPTRDENFRFSRTLRP